MIVTLFVLLTVAAAAQIVIAGRGTPLPGPTSPGQLPSLSHSPTP